MKISGYELLEVLQDVRFRNYNNTYAFVNGDCFSKSDIDSLAELLKDVLEEVECMELEIKEEK